MEKKSQVQRGQTSDGKVTKDRIEDQFRFGEDAIKSLLESSVITEDQITEENQFIQSPELSVT